MGRPRLDHDDEGRPKRCPPNQHEFKPRVTGVTENASDGVRKLNLRTVTEVFCGRCGEVRELQAPSSDGA